MPDTDFVRSHPDFREVLSEAEGRLQNISGETIPADAVAEFKKIGCLAEAAYWLAQKENHSEAHSLLSLKGEDARDKARRIADRIKRHGVFFEPVEEKDAVADYLAKRREQIRSGERRGFRRR